MKSKKIKKFIILAAILLFQLPLAASHSGIKGIEEDANSIYYDYALNKDAYTQTSGTIIEILPPSLLGISGAQIDRCTVKFVDNSGDSHEETVLRKLGDHVSDEVEIAYKMKDSKTNGNSFIEVTRLCYIKNSKLLIINNTTRIIAFLLALVITFFVIKKAWNNNYNQ